MCIDSDTVIPEQILSKRKIRTDYIKKATNRDNQIMNEDVKIQSEADHWPKY